MRAVIFLIFCTYGFSLLAQEVDVLTPQAWKERQMLEAQNLVLRTSARLSQLKNSKPAALKDSSLVAPNSRIKKSEVDPLIAAEKDLRRAQESQRSAADLGVEDYAAIYLPTLRDDPEAIEALAQRLSKQELAEIFKSLLKPSDAKHNNSSLAGSLSSIARAKSP